MISIPLKDYLLLNGRVPVGQSTQKSPLNQLKNYKYNH